MKLVPSRLSGKATASQRRLTNALPAELLVEIASHLTWTIDVLNFSLTSSQVRTILLPEMYKVVFLFGGAWSAALEMFANRPELCAHIRTLEVDLFYEALRPERQQDGDIDHIATLVDKVAAGLVNLHTFEWTAKRLPPDHLFLTLRNACPKLKNLHIYVNTISFDPASELFKFDDLSSFFLRVEHDDTIDEFPFFFWQDIPVQLGDMLLQRCPNLDSLVIRLRSVPDIWVHEIDRLVSGVWPKLEFLHLDIDVIDSDPISFWPPLSTLRNFLSAHSGLTELGLTAYAIFPTTVFSRDLPLCFEPNASCQVTWFDGLWQHVAALPNPAALKTLLLSTVVTDASLVSVLPVLRGLTSLTELTLEFTDIDPATAIRNIVSACPRLTSLHLKFYKNTFTPIQLKEVSIQLKSLLQLRSLYLDAVYSSTGGTLLKAALMLLDDIPLLEEILIITFMDKIWHQRGHYLILKDTKGQRFISARESGKDRGYLKGRFGRKVYPQGKFSRTFRYPLGRHVLGSISKGLKRIRR
ncbi:hypothetical protein B0H11DRAFT_635511 [Mycena galericulata]|nr:hypothetical protein B0H11DRAFT_635511 [Mycena galericulata]